MEKTFLYKVKDDSESDYAGELVNVSGSLIAVENPDGSADIYYPVIRKVDYIERIDVDFQLLPVFVPKSDLVDARTVQDYADLFNAEENTDLNRFKWLQGNPQMGLTLHLTPEGTYASKKDSFNDEEDIRFNFDIVYDISVTTLIDLMGIKTESSFSDIIDDEIDGADAAAITEVQNRLNGEHITDEEE